jgi:predicted nucleic acid-binding protein
VNRVTADSNIYVSALLRGGKPLELFELARFRHIELAVSDAILEETAPVLATSSGFPTRHHRVL